MRKNTLYIIFSAITIMSLFIVAATCSFCGIQFDNGSSATETEGKESTAASDTTSTQTSNDDRQEPGERVNTNYAPQIVNIIHNGEDITEMLGSEALPIRVGITEEHIFTVIASDEDNDELKFSVEASEGEIDGLHKIDATSAEFSYIPPSSIVLSEDFEIPLPAVITVNAVDSAGGEDTFTIDIGLSPGVIGVARVAIIGTDSTNSGYITQDNGERTGIVLTGDDNSNKQLKGYLSFDLSDLYRLESFDIDSANIYFNSINKSGDPADISNVLDFKTIEYGTLDPSDFAPGGVRIVEVDTNIFLSSGSYTINSAELLNTLIEAVNANKPFYQIKMGLKSATNSNGAFDIIEIHPENVSLGVGIDVRF